MRMFGLKALVAVTLTLASVATPSLAGSLYYGPMGEPMTADEADMVMQNRMMDPGMVAVQPRPAGRYNCGPDEKRTHLERQACGATRGVY